MLNRFDARANRSFRGAQRAGPAVDRGGGDAHRGSSIQIDIGKQYEFALNADELGAKRGGLFAPPPFWCWVHMFWWPWTGCNHFGTFWAPSGSRIDHLTNYP